MKLKFLSHWILTVLTIPFLFSCAKVNYDKRGAILPFAGPQQGLGLINNKFIMTEGERRDFQIEFNAPLASNVNFDWSIQPKEKSVVVNQRFKTVTGQAAGKSGQKFVSVHIEAVDIDNIQQGTQQFVIVLVPQGSRESLPSDLTLLDAHKLPELRYRLDTISVPQATKSELILELSEVSQLPVIIYLEGKDGSAKKNIDYEPIWPKEIKILPGMREIALPIETLDHGCRSDQFFNVIVTKLSGASMANRVAKVIIPEDPVICNPPPPPPPIIDILQQHKEMSEGENRTFGIEFLNLFVQHMEFSWTITSNNPGVRLSDRFKVYSGTTRVQPGDKLAYINVSAVDINNLREGDQEFTIHLAAAGLSQDFQVGLTLYDKVKTPSLKFAKHRISISNRQNGLATLVLSEPSSLPVSIDIETQDGSAFGNTDYVPVKSRLVIPPGSLTVDVPIILIPQTLCKKDLEFYLVVTQVENAIMENRRATIAIPRDADLCKPPPPVIDIVKPQHKFMSEGERRKIDIEFINGFIQNMDFNWTITPVDNSIRMTDRFKVFNGSSTAKKNSRTLTIDVSAVDINNIKEGDQEFVIHLVPEGQNNLEFLIPLTLYDKYKQPSLRFDKNPIKIANRKDGIATLILSEPSTQTVELDIETQDGSAIGNVDYVPVRVHLTIPAGAISVDVPITLIPQTECKDDLKFYLVVTNTVNATMSSNRATLYIPKDKELCTPPPPPPPIPQPASGEIKF